MLNVVMLNDTPNLFMVSDIVLSVEMLNVAMLGVVMLSVVAPVMSIAIFCLLNKHLHPSPTFASKFRKPTLAIGLL